MRHGETDWNADRRLQGQSDVPLNKTGCAQAAAAAKVLGGLSICRIVTSPSIRALKTAAVIAEELKLSISVDSRLTERHFGPLEGQCALDIRRSHGLEPNETLRRLSSNGVEEWSDLRVRAYNVVVDWLAGSAAGLIMFVGHGGFLEALGDSLEVEIGICRHATPYLFHFTGSNWAVREVPVPDF